jgi:hypothetical protein
MYRDERDVLRDEVFALRREIEQARADQDRLVVAEKELAMARLELARLVRPKPERGGAPVVVGVAVALLLVGVAGVLTLRASPRRSPIAAPVQAPVEAPTAVATVTAAVVTATATEPPKVPPRTARVHWRATVTKVQGVGVGVGSPCTIDAMVVADPEGMHADDVVVKCGAHVLYDASCELEGTSSSGSDAEQRGGTKPGTWSYGFAFSDVGTRGPSCNQVMLDSSKKLGKVWSENLPEFRVDLAVAPNSDPTDVAVRVE